MGKLCSALILSCSIFLISSLFLKVPSAHAATELFSTSFSSDASLVSYYRFESNSNDFTGTNNGTDVSMVYNTSSGEFGDGADFSGSNYITLGNVGSLSFTGPQAFSVSFWVNFTTNSNLQIVGKNSTLNHTAKGWSVMVAGGMLYLQINGGTSSGANELQVNSGNFNPHYNDGQFHFATVTYDGSKTAAGILLYIDGVLQPTAGYNIDFNNLSASAANSVDAVIGAVSGGGFNFNGSVDDLAIFSRVLSGSEILSLYGSFYAQIENTDHGRWLLRSTPATSTNANLIERLPEDWIVDVSSTINTTTTGGYTWYDVVDPTDGVEGWMAASSSGASYLEISTGTHQSDLIAIASTTLSTTNQRADTAFYAVDWYYNNSSTTNSLYSSDNGNNELSMFKTGVLGANTYSAFPEQIILGIAATEDGTAGNNFNNEIITHDYGHGVMQLTPYQVFANEPTSTGDWASNTENVPSNGSFLEIFPCRSYDEFNSVGTDTYINCYTFAGTADSIDTKAYQSYAGIGGNPEYKWYGNTTQSIYANIKDGMRQLQDKYGVFDPITTSTATSSVTYSGPEREIIFATSLYNGSGTAACSYVATVANSASNLPSIFPDESGNSILSTSSISDTLQKMQDAGNDEVCAVLHSPATLSVKDSDGRVLGMVNNKIENQFPLAISDQDGKWVHIFAAPSGQYTFTVTGAGAGEYGFDFVIKHGATEISFSTKNMPVIPKQIDTYAVDPSAIMNGQGGITLQVDTQGNGIINKVENLAGATVINLGSNVITPELASISSVPASPPKILFNKTFLPLITGIPNSILENSSSILGTSSTKI